MEEATFKENCSISTATVETAKMEMMTGVGSIGYILYDNDGDEANSKMNCKSNGWQQQDSSNAGDNNDGRGNKDSRGRTMKAKKTVVEMMRTATMVGVG